MSSLEQQAVADFTCPECEAKPGRPCRRKSTDWTGKRTLWKRAPLHPERVVLAYQRMGQ